MTDVSARHRVRLAVALALGLTLPAFSTTLPAHAATSSARPVVVATYNTDFGTNLARLFTITDMTKLPAAANAAYQKVFQSNYPERAATAAGIIAKAKPDVIGLQEVAKWEEFDLANKTAPPVVKLDYLALLQSALTKAKAPYNVAVTNTTFQGSLPISATTAVRFTDMNVILVRGGVKDISFTAPTQAQYLTRIPLASLGLAATRGWASADVTVGRSSFRFFTTHLEAYTAPNLAEDFFRNPQAKELVALVNASPLPAVVTGDINSRPTCTAKNTAAYDLIVAAGMTDVWPGTHPKNPCTTGYTSGGRDVTVAGSGTLDHRIDDVFVKTGKVTVMSAALIGATEKTSGGLWPSDHAGTVATVKFVK